MCEGTSQLGETALQSDEDMLAEIVNEPLSAGAARVCTALKIDRATCDKVASLLEAKRFQAAIHKLRAAGIADPVESFDRYGVRLPL